MGLGFAVSQKALWEQIPHAAFRAAALSEFRSFEKDYVEFVNDGLSLINRHRRSNETVMALDFSNPFSYALGLKPAPGGATTLHYRGNFSETHHPAPDRLFGQANLVVVPLVPSEKELELSIARIYGPYLAAHYHLIGTSDKWRLYRRDQDSSIHHAL